VQTVRLAGDRLDVTLEVHADDLPMPAWSGFHPWFARRLRTGDGTGVGRPVRLDVPAAGRLRPDDEGLPTEEVVAVGDGPWDATFAGVTWPATLTWDDALRLTVTADTPWAVVFDERPEAVCVEPQTAPPAATDLGGAAAAPVVEPGAPAVLHMAWHVEQLRAERP
jgi:aldose 1-epimerase